MSCADSDTDDAPLPPPVKKKRRSRSFLPKIFSPFKRTPKKNSVTPSDQQITYCKKDNTSNPPKIEICTAKSDSISIKSSKSNSIRSILSGSIISEDWNPLNGIQFSTTSNPKLTNGSSLSASASPHNNNITSSASPVNVRIHSPASRGSNGRSPSIGSQSLTVPFTRKDRANSNISIFTEEELPSFRSGAYMPGFAKNRFKQIFDMFDKNGDNVINVEELSGILEILGYSPTVDEVRTILERFDQDNSGTIDFDEYLILIQHWIEQDEEQIYEAFKVFDKDGDGFVSAQELKRALTQYGEQFTEDEANEFFNMMDTDGDGVINYEEFVEYLRSMQKYSADQ